MMKSKRVLKELCFRQEHVSFLNGGKIRRDGLRKSLFSTNSPGTSIGNFLVQDEFFKGFMDLSSKFRRFFGDFLSLLFSDPHPPCLEFVPRFRVRTKDTSDRRKLRFWFVELHPKQHWIKDPKLDDEIKTRFERTLFQARACELFEWRKNPKGRLAEIIVLDQFSRNIYRELPGSGRVFQGLHGPEFQVPKIFW